MSNVEGILGLAARARKLAMGDSVMKNIQNKRARLVIISVDTGDNMRKKIIDKCTYYQIPYVFIESSEVLSNAVGANNRKMVAVLDKGFALQLQTCLKG